MLNGRKNNFGHKLFYSVSLKLGMQNMFVFIGILSAWLTVYSGFHLSGFPYCFCKHFPPNCITCVAGSYSRNENGFGMRMSLKYLSERWSVTSFQMVKVVDVSKKSWAYKNQEKKKITIGGSCNIFRGGIFVFGQQRRLLLHQIQSGSCSI